MNTPKKTRHYQNYKNVGGKSPILKFELEKDAVNLRYASAAFRYTNQSAGPANIAKMKTLALAGKGLDTFVQANLKDRFERKIR